MSDAHPAPFVSAIVLAAGASTRLGRPKQLLEIAGVSLIRRAASRVVDAGPDETIVVTGAHHEAVASQVEGLDLRIVHNADWQVGLASSIHRGLDAANDADRSAVLLALADQPELSASLLSRILEAHRVEGRDLVAARYDGNLGSPALFGRAYEPELRALEGDVGARHILTTYADGVTAVAFEGGEIDIDEEADWERYRARN